MGFDESVSAESDAPVPGPPPAAAQIGSLFASPPPSHTVLRAPLRAADNAAPPEPPEVGGAEADTVPAIDNGMPEQDSPSPPPSPAQPVWELQVDTPAPPAPAPPPSAPVPPPQAASDAAFAALLEATENLPPGSGAEQVPGSPTEPARGSPAGPVPGSPAEPAEPGAEPGAEQYCALCGMRTPVDASGERCQLGHPISAAHGARARRWWQRG